MCLSRIELRFNRKRSYHEHGRESLLDLMETLSTVYRFLALSGLSVLKTIPSIRMYSLLKIPPKSYKYKPLS